MMCIVLYLFHELERKQRMEIRNCPTCSTVPSEISSVHVLWKECIEHAGAFQTPHHICCSLRSVPLSLATSHLQNILMLYTYWLILIIQRAVRGFARNHFLPFTRCDRESRTKLHLNNLWNGLNGVSRSLAWVRIFLFALFFLGLFVLFLWPTFFPISWRRMPIHLRECVAIFWHYRLQSSALQRPIWSLHEISATTQP